MAVFFWQNIPFRAAFLINIVLALNEEQLLIFNWSRTNVELNV